MAAIHLTTMTLRFFGDDLDPDELTTRLGRSPFSARRKGEVWQTATGRKRIAQTGSWRLKVDDRTPENIDGQVAELLGSLSDDLSIWKDLTTRFEADLFCGLFMQISNEGLSLSPKTMSDLGARNLQIGFDVYDSGTRDS